MRELFLLGLRRLYGIELQLAADVLPMLRERVRANDLASALDRHRLETEAHAENVRRVFTLVGEEHAAVEASWLATFASPADGDLAVLAAVLRIEAVEIASYTFLEHSALALGVDELAIHLLRRNKGQEVYALEQAEHALVKLLAEKVES